MKIYTNEMIKEKYARKNRKKKIIRIITTPVVVLILLLAIYTGYFKFIKKSNNISFFGYKQYIVMTGSMEPSYNIGDLIFEKEIAKEDIKLNDVITYSLENGQDTVTHRVVDIIEENGETYYQFKGDNNNSPDPDLVTYKQIQGKVIYKINKLGSLIAEFVSGTGVILILIIFILSYMKTNRKEERRIAREDARSRYNKPKYIDDDSASDEKYT